MHYPILNPIIWRWPKAPRKRFICKIFWRNSEYRENPTFCTTIEEHRRRSRTPFFIRERNTSTQGIISSVTRSSSNAWKQSFYEQNKCQLTFWQRACSDRSTAIAPRYSTLLTSINDIDSCSVLCGVCHLRGSVRTGLQITPTPLSLIQQRVKFLWVDMLTLDSFRTGRDDSRARKILFVVRFASSKPSRTCISAIHSYSLCFTTPEVPTLTDCGAAIWEIFHEAKLLLKIREITGHLKQPLWKNSEFFFNWTNQRRFRDVDIWSSMKKRRASEKDAKGTLSRSKIS